MRLPDCHTERAAPLCPPMPRECDRPTATPKVGNAVCCLCMVSRSNYFDRFLPSSPNAFFCAGISLSLSLSSSSACRLVKRFNEEHDARYVRLLSGLELGASLIGSIGTRHVGHGHDFHLGNCAPRLFLCRCCAVTTVRTAKWLNRG